MWFTVCSEQVKVKSSQLEMIVIDVDRTRTLNLDLSAYFEPVVYTHDYCKGLQYSLNQTEPGMTLTGNNLSLDIDTLKVGFNKTFSVK